MADLVAARHRTILKLAQETGKVNVEELATLLDITPQTIRKDLKLLAENNVLTRVHGGAVIASGVDNIAYTARMQVSRDAKDAIGRTAAALVPVNASVFINIGTTTEAVARHLRGHDGLMVISNNLNVIDILAPNPNIDVIVVGGRVRAKDRATVGALATEFIQNFKVDYAIIGTSAIDVDGALLDFDMNEVQVSQTIIRHARHVMLVADASKVGRAAPVRIAPIESVGTFVTDRLTNEALADILIRGGVRVVEALA